MRTNHLLLLSATLLGALALLVAGCPDKPAEDEGEGEATAEPAPITNPMVVFDLAATDEQLEEPVVPEDGVETASYVVGTRDSDVVAMLELLRAGKRAEIVVPEVQGDLTLDVSTLWLDAADFDGNGQADRLLVRWAVVPRLGAVTTSAWIVAVMADDAGTIGPDQEKEGVLVAAAMVDGTTCPLIVGGQQEDGSLFVDMLDAEGAWTRHTATPREATADDKLAADRDRDVALVTSAMQVYDTGVLAPETAYVKAFIVKACLPEVEAVEPTRDLVFPEILRPLYGALKLVQRKLDDPVTATAYTEAEVLLPVMTGLLVHEGDLRLGLSADELKQRMAGLQQLGDEFGAIQDALTFDGEKMRRRDFEVKLGQVADADERARITAAYQDAFRPMVAADGSYPKFIAEMNEIARAHGYANYPDMRMREKFGVDLDGYYTWTDETWAATEADARAFITSLEEFAGAESLTYWQVGQLTDAWVLAQVGLDELPKLSEAAAQAVLQQYYQDVGLDMTVEPYSRITMDWYQDDLKWNRAGTAATATPEQAYFTSNIIPGTPIAIDEWETPMHETAHTLHYQTSGAQAPGLSSFQNNMPSYIAEGVAMTFEDAPVCTPQLMTKYFGGKEGFTDELFEVYPQARGRAAAWQTRRLLLMGMYEVNLYVDRNPDGTERSWEERVGAWDGLVRERLFVEPPADSLAQIMCRSHPFDDQSQLGYSSYSLGVALVRNVRDRTLTTGTGEELTAFGAAMIELMAQGALADRASAQAIIDGLGSDE